MTKDNWVKDTIVTHTLVKLDWCDRFKVLMTGLVSIRTFTNVDQRVERHETWHTTLIVGNPKPPKDGGQAVGMGYAVVDDDAAQEVRNG